MASTSLGIAQRPPTPRVRRIFWVSGPPSSGKTTFTRYLEQEYEGGIVNFGVRIEMARCLLAYRGHSLVVYDCPRSYEWPQHRTQVGVMLELFSEYGSFRRSTMYGGQRIQIANHLLVFANAPPIDDVDHRIIDHTVLTEGPELPSSQASTIPMGPVYDPLRGVERQLTSASSARERSRSRSVRRET